MPQEQDDNVIPLIDRASQGDVNAFGELYDLYFDGIFRFLNSHLGNVQDAEDLAEEVFLRIWQSLPNYQHQGVPFAAFIYRVARNILTDHYRRSSGSRTEIAVDEELIDHISSHTSEGSFDNLEHLAIRQVLGELREDYRNILILRFYTGLAPDEIAQSIGKTPGATRVLQFRALEAMRKLLDKGIGK
jgi:RNA polymerase sigma-70 factor (ECF subfamily)